MFVALDDTDSVEGMCTTYLAVEILRRTGLDLIGYPELVRLNPNIKYKTRGNGAVVIRLGNGFGDRSFAGMIDGHNVQAYASERGPVDLDHVFDVVSGIIDEFSVKDDPRTNPGLVVTDERYPEKLYRNALSREVSQTEILPFLEGGNTRYRQWGNGRGIIGAASALGWRRRLVTYELLSYTFPRPQGVSHSSMMEAVEGLESRYPETFSNIDRENRHAAIFPVNRTPVAYGVRSTDPSRMKSIHNYLRKAHGIDPGSSIIYITNQGTDDHVTPDPQVLEETGSYSITGRVLKEPWSIQGGHCFTILRWNGSDVRVAAFEPTKQFRDVFRQLRPGDLARITGSYGDGTLKAEKLEVVSVSAYFHRTPPQCSNCGSGMKSRGKNDYRCRECGRKSSLPGYSEEERKILPGKYEVPVSARRHLSMPLDLEEHFRSVAAAE